MCNATLEILMAKSQKFTFLLMQDFSHLAFACAVEPLRIANLVAGRDLYDWAFISEDGTQAISSDKTITLVHAGLEPLDRDTYLFVLSGLNVWEHISPETLAFLRRQKAHGIEIGALCSAAFVLAEAGFLEDKKVALHWEYHDAFMEKYPNVNLCRNVFVDTEQHITASGGTATADLMLHRIELDHGAELAAAVSDQMVYTAPRGAAAEQRASVQARNAMRNPHLAQAIQIMSDALEEPMHSSAIAAQIGISTRQLERLFGRNLNCSPGKYFMELRLNKAQHLLVQTEASVTEISIACGFSSQSHFSRVYRTHFGITPQAQQSKTR